MFSILYSLYAAVEDTHTLAHSIYLLQYGT